MDEENTQQPATTFGNTRTIHDETKKRWYDHIHSNHICFSFFMLATVALLAIVIGYLVPVWIYGPTSTQCTLITKAMNSSFIGEDLKATYRKFRTEFNVKYQAYIPQQGKDMIIQSTMYGPSVERWDNPREAGYVLSYAIRNEFYNNYQVGQVFDCFYSSSDPYTVVIEYDPRYYSLIALPIISFLLGLWVLCYPPIEKYIRAQFDQRQQFKQYMEISQMEETYDKEMEARVASDLFFDDTVGAYRRIGTGEIVQPSAEGEDLDDEFELIEEEIEVIGKFFGKSVEEHGTFVQKPISELDRNETSNIKIVSQSQQDEEEDPTPTLEIKPAVTQPTITPQYTLLVLDDDSEDEEDDDDYDD
ncbi:predicted protein [Naegleria gruberi]|uniref:Predicted protein n=1 Tax=Naegleria gruberi TaxID=5762 RepID=D2VQ03_NAEGR|nr:uncharacterized protein NAEGRDRAFT_51392 [Naegleria gruberi]EFC41024.1 predicted protein [Naegleria gruberi]|eukprot:XP_002673768.1 predicted protein [Naegleria gruberi strain NEG-M]